MMKAVTALTFLAMVAFPAKLVFADEPKKEEPAKESAAKADAPKAEAPQVDFKKKFAELRQAHLKSQEKLKKLKEEMRTAPSEERINLGLQWKIAWKEYTQAEITLFDFLDDRNAKDLVRFTEAIERYQKEIEKVKTAIEETKKAVEQRKTRRAYLEKTLKEEQ